MHQQVSVTKALSVLKAKEYLTLVQQALIPTLLHSTLQAMQPISLVHVLKVTTARSDLPIHVPVSKVNTSLMLAKPHAYRVKNTIIVQLQEWKESDQHALKVMCALLAQRWPSLTTTSKADCVTKAIIVQVVKSSHVLMERSLQ